MPMGFFGALHRDFALPSRREQKPLDKTVKAFPNEIHLSLRWTACFSFHLLHCDNKLVPLLFLSMPFCFQKSSPQWQIIRGFREVGITRSQLKHFRSPIRVNSRKLKSHGSMVRQFFHPRFTLQVVKIANQIIDDTRAFPSASQTIWGKKHMSPLTLQSPAQTRGSWFLVEISNDHPRLIVMWLEKFEKILEKILFLRTVLTINVDQHSAAKLRANNMPPWPQFSLPRGTANRVVDQGDHATHPTVLPLPGARFPEHIMALPTQAAGGGSKPGHIPGRHVDFLKSDDLKAFVSECVKSLPCIGSRPSVKTNATNSLAGRTWIWLYPLCSEIRPPNTLLERR